MPNTLRLVIGDNHGAGRDGRLPLGWILFDDVAAPEQEIYLSRTSCGTTCSRRRSTPNEA